jgi:hypothetical protein
VYACVGRRGKGGDSVFNLMECIVFSGLSTLLFIYFLLFLSLLSNIESFIIYIHLTLSSLSKITTDLTSYYVSDCIYCYSGTASMC